MTGNVKAQHGHISNGTAIQRQWQQWDLSSPKEFYQGAGGGGSQTTLGVDVDHAGLVTERKSNGIEGPQQGLVACRQIMILKNRDFAIVAVGAEAIGNLPTGIGSKGSILNGDLDGLGGP